MSDPVVVTPATLAEHPLPDHGESSSKDDRGGVLVVGGTAQTPGAALLSGLAALRAGAGRLQVATDPAHLAALGLALPEALVFPALGSDAPPSALDDVVDAAGKADAVLVGPGTAVPDTTREVVAAVADALADGDGVLVLDAGALPVVADAPELVAPLGARCLLVPNPSELAEILGDASDDDPAVCLGRAVDRFGCAVAIRGGETWLAAPGGPAHVDRSGCIGLATSGSGDVLAGIVAGLSARGADATSALLWAVHVHARAGRRCAARQGPVGFLARELLDEIAPVLRELAA